MNAIRLKILLIYYKVLGKLGIIRKVEVTRLQYNAWLAYSNISFFDGVLDSVEMPVRRNDGVQPRSKQTDNLE